MRFRTAVLTISDRGSRGEREDLSGPAIVESLTPISDVVWTGMLPDDLEQIAACLRRLADDNRADLILTTGGTGLSPRDVTPEATWSVAEKVVPGIAEAMRAESMRITNRGMLSRGIAVVRSRSLIINLPGSPKAVRECLHAILPALPHGMDILCGAASECAAQP